MDDFYESGINIIENTTTYNGQNYNYVLARGGNEVGWCTSEALCYFLNYVVNKYILNKKNGNNTTVYVTHIIHIINTLTHLYKQNLSDSYKNVYFPKWRFNTSGNVYDQYEGNAQDSNLEILKSFLRLILFDNAISGNASLILPIINNDIVPSFNTTNLNIVIHQVILMLSYNTINTGNFKQSSPNLCFGDSCLGGLQGTGNYTPSESIIDKGHLDYINFSCFVYLVKYYNTYSITSSQSLNTIMIQSTQLTTSTRTIPTYTNLINNLGFAIDYISTVNFTNVYPSGIFQGDNYNANLNRLTYQITEILILINKGDVMITSNDAFSIWNTTLAMNSTYTNILTTSMNSFINTEIGKNSLYLETINNQYKPHFTNEINNGNDIGLTSADEVGYARCLTYLIYMNMYPSNITSNRGSFYIENYKTNINNYFGFNTYTGPDAFQQQANIWALNHSTTNTQLFNFNGKWINSNTWNTDDNTKNQYFSWVLMMLHINNYRLFTQYLNS
jgi:hypothetical protein